jgi:hypothetical protein
VSDSQNQPAAAETAIETVQSRARSHNEANGVSSPSSSPDQQLNSMWSDVSQLRSALADSGFNYSQIFPISTSRESSVSPPQLVFKCSSIGCTSRLVVDLQESGAYKLQPARSKLDHHHSEEAVASSTTRTDEEGGRATAARSPSPSPVVPAKRSLMETGEAEETQETEEGSGSKRSAFRTTNAVHERASEEAEDAPALIGHGSRRLAGSSVRRQALIKLSNAEC